MTSDETKFFQLVDAYSRSRYRCFVAEMFPTVEHQEYTVCLRPIDRSLESPERSDCRYLRIHAAEVRTAGQSGVLGLSMSEELDAVLRSWR